MLRHRVIQHKKSPKKYIFFSSNKDENLICSHADIKKTTYTSKSNYSVISVPKWGTETKQNKQKSPEHEKHI